MSIQHLEKRKATMRHFGAYLSFIVCVSIFSSAFAKEKWKDKNYSSRYTIRVSPPPAAGSMGLLPEITTAFVRLPLRVFTDSNGNKKSEIILLTDDEGSVLPVVIVKGKNGEDSLVAFQTRSGRRRFFLYSGVPESKNPKDFSPEFRMKAFPVHVVGRSIPKNKIYQPGRPLKFETFQSLFPPEKITGDIEKLVKIDDERLPFPDPVLKTAKLLKPVPPETDPVFKPNYAALYESLLRTPVTGEYSFAVDTPGVTYLLIDGSAVCGSGTPNKGRGPFSIQGTIKLKAGVHRLNLYHATAGGKPGIRLHWKPPFSNGFIRVPAQVLPRALPAEVKGLEVLSDSSEKGGFHSVPTLHLEVLGRARSQAHRGPKVEREYLLVCGKVADRPGFVEKGGTSQSNMLVEILAGEKTVYSREGRFFSVWVPAERDVEIIAKEKLADGTFKQFGRRLSWFVSKIKEDKSLGVLSKLDTKRHQANDLLELEAELVMKSAPKFIHPNEAAQFYFETIIRPIPKLYTKHELERYRWVPPVRPMGEYKLTWTLKSVSDEDGAESVLQSGELDATPGSEVPKRFRLPFSGKDLIQTLEDSNFGVLEIQLRMGGILAGREAIRIFGSTSKLPGELFADRDGIWVKPPVKGNNAQADRVLMVVPREKEEFYRRNKPLQVLLGADIGGEAMFLGDPLVDEIPKGETLVGLAKELSKRLGNHTWSGIQVKGTTAERPVYELLVGLENWMHKKKTRKLPGLVVVSLGYGDSAGQTPLHDFGRCLDVLIDRLRLGGVKLIYFVGVIPEPEKMLASVPYQKSLLELLRRHHLYGLNVINIWKKEKDWSQKYRISGVKSKSILGPVPNNQTIKEMSVLIKEKLE